MNRLLNIRGLLVPIFEKNHIEATMDYTPLDGDVVIASYPKTGTHWLHYIVLQIISGGELFPSMDDLTHKVGPFMEMAGVEAIEAVKDPRSFKHHYPYNMVKKNEKSKYLYIYRNPEDILVSYYHFLKEVLHVKIDFDEYFENFITGKIAYGSYFDHVLSYYAHEDDGNLLMISYEKLHANRKQEMRRIAKFLGEDYFQSLFDESLLDGIIERTSFDNMKKTLQVSNPRAKSNKGTLVNFFRKGVVGDGKCVLTEKQNERLKTTMLEKMKGTRFVDEWTRS